MYNTCLYCQQSLGSNDSVESFPVGRRVAFDATLGRLWAVCRRCERWNLAPFDTRWEAIEQSERLYRDTRVRVSTDNIGLARLRDGTELVRIGKPLRPEFAAWRYGDQFGRRRIRAAALGIGAVSAAGLGIAGLAGAGLGVAGVAVGIHLVTMLSAVLSKGVEGKPLRDPSGQLFRPIGFPKLVQLDNVDEGWGVDIGYTQMLTEPMMPLMRTSNNGVEMGRILFRGNEATPILRRYMPRINSAGASRSTVNAGVALIEEAGDPDNFGRWAAQQRRRWGAMQTSGDTGSLAHIPAPARLAFEMALFEAQEKRALLGELHVLENAWRDAEEIAAIADGLLISDDVTQRVEKLKGDVGG